MATQTPTNPSYGSTFSPLRGDPALGSLAYPFVVPTTITAGTTATITASAMLSGLILHDPTGAATDTFDTAANIIAALQGAAVNQAFYFDLVNIADGNETITLAAGTGVTLATYTPAAGTYTVVQNNGKRFVCIVTALGNLSGTVLPAVTIYSLGTYVF